MVARRRALRSHCYRSEIDSSSALHGALGGCARFESVLMFSVPSPFPRRNKKGKCVLLTSYLFTFTLFPTNNCLPPRSLRPRESVLLSSVAPLNCSLCTLNIARSSGYFICMTSVDLYKHLQIYTSSSDSCQEFLACHPRRVPWGNRLAACHREAWR